MGRIEDGGIVRLRVPLQVRPGELTSSIRLVFCYGRSWIERLFVGGMEGMFSWLFDALCWLYQ